MGKKYLDDDSVIDDGDSISVPLLLCDSAARDHQPHYGRPDVSDARTAARDARNEMIKRAENAWRTPTPSRDAAEPDLSSPPELMRRHLAEKPDADDAQARRDASWAAYRDQLGNAWRTNPNAATAIEQQAERWRGGR